MAIANSKGATGAPSRPLDIHREVGLLNQLTIDQLRKRYAEVSGESTNSRHRKWLIRRIAWQLQANAYGGLSERAIERARELANIADLKTTPLQIAEVPVSPERTKVADVVFGSDNRLPLPGSTIARHYKGQKLIVRVMPNGFEYEGQVFKSLSAVAKKITGSHCNGFHFFRLTGGDR